MANLITRLTTWLNGDLVGTDPLGNRYYQQRKKSAGARRRRWAVFHDGSEEPTLVPPAWHAWLHYTIDDFPQAEEMRPRAWEREHQPNVTGTDQAYRPPGHTLMGGKRDHATGDYQPWTPD
jgi:NADH:ubiquinone oxidoreductase subunit